MKQLSTIKPGECVVVTSIQAPMHIKRRLLELGFTNETEIQVIKTAPLGDPIEYEIRGCHISLRKNDAACINVRSKV